MVDEIVTRQELIDAKRDARDLGEAVNEKVIVSPRYGDDFKSLPMIAAEAQTEINEWRSAIALITQEDGVPAIAVSDASGLTQQKINYGMNSIAEMMSIVSPANGTRLFVKGLQGGWFEYNASKSSINDGGTIFNGWVRIHYLNKMSNLSWFGAVPNDPASAAANEAKFISAISTGDVVIDGHYYIECNANNSISNSFSLLSDSANSKIEITKIKDGWIKVGSVDHIRLQGVKFAADLTFSGGLISIETPTVLINEVEISGCKFDIGCRIFDAVFSKTDDPTVTPYGIKRIKILDNEINHSRTWFSTIDMPHEVIEIKRNRGRNISNICINISSNLTHPYAAKLVMLMKRAEVEFNTIINDDDFFPSAVGAYQTFFLYEGSYCLYRNNWVEGLKSKLVTVIYDLYMNGGKLDYFDNTWKNNVCMAPNKQGNELMKSKQALVSHYHRNTFIVEKEFLQRHGGDGAGAGWVTLWTKTKGDDTSEVEIIGNKIDVYELLGMSTAALSKNVTIRGNTFKAERCASAFFNYPLLPTGMTDMTKAIIDIADNKFFIKDLGGEIIRNGSSYKGFELTRTNTYNPEPLSFYREISIQDNEINADTISGAIYGIGDKLVAKNIKVQGNKYNIYSQSADSSFRGFGSTYITPIDRFESSNNEIVMHDGTLALNTALDAKLPANVPSVFKNNFKGIFSNFITYIKSPTANNLQVIVKLSVKTTQGKQSGSYKVKLTPTGVIYTDVSDVENTVPYSTSGTTYVNPKLLPLDPLDTLLAGVRLGVGVAGAIGGSVVIDYRFTGAVNNVTPVDYDVDIETFVI